MLLHSLPQPLCRHIPHIISPRVHIFTLTLTRYGKPPPICARPIPSDWKFFQNPVAGQTQQRPAPPPNQNPVLYSHSGLLTSTVAPVSSHLDLLIPFFSIVLAPSHRPHYQTIDKFLAQYQLPDRASF